MAGRIEQDAQVFAGDAGKLQQSGGVQFPAFRLAGWYRYHMAGNQSVAAAELQRFHPFVTDILPGIGFPID
jgi:hypothetical protein